MIRVALLLAISSVPSACSAGEMAGDSIAAGNGSSAAARAEAAAPGRQIDRGTAATMSEIQIVITSDEVRFNAVLIDNKASRALLRMLPLTVEMRDHLRQEKTGNLPSPLPEVERQTDFSAGTLGLWGNDDFVIYYRHGRVPPPGTSVLGRVVGDVAKLDRPGPVTVRIERAR